MSNPQQSNQLIVSAGQPVQSVDADGVITGDYWPSNVGGGLYGEHPATGLVVTEREAMSSATAYACTRAISETLGSLPGLVFQNLPGGVRNRDREHPAWSLLHDEPNPEMDSMQFYEMGTSRMTNRGNFFAEIVRDSNDRPVQLWPLHNSRVRPWRNDDGELTWLVAHDDKCDFTRSEQGYRYSQIPDRNLFNLVGGAALDGSGCLSNGVLPRATEELSLDIAQQQYGAKFFGTGGKPSAIVEHPGFIKDPLARQSFRSDLNQTHSGFENWNQIGVLWEGAKWKEISASPEQAQFVESRQFQSKVICRWYNVPPAIVQIFDDYKFSTVDAMLRQFVLTCIRPLAVRWERAVNRQILRRRNTSTGRLVSNYTETMMLEFLLDALLRGDPKQQAEVNEIRWRSGTLSADEWRAQDNENPLPNDQGTHYMVPSNFTTVERAASGQNLGGGGSSASTSQSASGNLPRFDRAFLIDALKESVESDRVSRGIGADFEPTSEQADAPENVPANTAYAERVTAEAFGRMLRVEMVAVSRIAGKIKSPDAASKAIKSIATFYAGHESRLAEAVAIGIEGMSDSDAVASTLAARYCKERKAEEIEAVASIETAEQLTQWQESTASELDQQTIDSVAADFVANAKREIGNA